MNYKELLIYIKAILLLAAFCTLSPGVGWGILLHTLKMSQPATALVNSTWWERLCADLGPDFKGPTRLLSSYLSAFALDNPSCQVRCSTIHYSLLVKPPYPKRWGWSGTGSMRTSLQTEVPWLFVFIVVSPPREPQLWRTEMALPRFSVPTVSTHRAQGQPTIIAIWG